MIFTEYTTKNKIRYKRYKCSKCNDCSKKPLGTTAKEGRNLQRWIFEDTLEQLAEDTLAHNETYKQRRCIVEHFLRNGKHYLITSGTTGYFPNPGKVDVFDEMPLFILFQFRQKKGRFRYS